MLTRQLFSIRNLVYLVFIGVITGQLVRLGVSSDTSGSVLFLDIVLGLYVFFGGFMLLVARQRIQRPVSLIFLAYFMLWVGVTLLMAYPTLSGGQFLTAAFYALRFIMMCAAIFITATLFRDENDQLIISNTFIASGMILTLLGFIQLIIFPNFSFMARFGWDPHNHRLLSTFFDPNFFGMFLVMLFSVILARLFFTKRLRTQFLFGFFLVAIALAIGLTLSRSTYLAFAIATSIILLIHSWRLFFVLVIAGMVALTFSPRLRTRVMGAFELDTTASIRLVSWNRSLTIAADHPLVGVGYNAYGAAQFRYGYQKNLTNLSAQGADSSLLLIAATTGFIGLIIYIFFLAGLTIEAMFVYSHATSPFYKSMGLAMLGLLPAYVAHSQFVNGLFYPLLFVPFGFITSALLVGIKNNAERKQ